MKKIKGIRNYLAVRKSALQDEDKAMQAMEEGDYERGGDLYSQAGKKWISIGYKFWNATRARFAYHNVSDAYREAYKQSPDKKYLEKASNRAYRHASLISRAEEMDYKGLGHKPGLIGSLVDKFEGGLFKIASKLAEPRSKRASKIRIASLVLLIIGIFFLSSNITGNVIGDMTNSTSNIIGAVLLVIGLIGGFFWIKNRKK